MSKVLKDFMCKVTNVIYRAGEEYEGKRQKELQELGYVSEEKKKNRS